MIIWINGSFGSGKTQTSRELHKRISNSFIYDPEYTGYYLRKVIPGQLTQDDFQNYVKWREFNYEMLKYLDSEYAGIIIVPMTIVELHIFDELVGRLRRDGVTVYHFTLCASAETLRKRLRGRGDGKKSWAAQQIERCVEGLKNEAFQYPIDTENRSVEEIAESIAALAQIALLPDHRGKYTKKWDRFWTQLKHIHWFH